MKAFVLTGHGDINNLVLSDLEVPTCAGHEVLIRTRAVSVNRVDSFVRQNDFAVNVFYKPNGRDESIVLGWDVSGEILAVGGDVKDLKVGDDVFGLVNFFGRGRSNAEYVTAPAAHLTVKPSNVTHEAAAASGLAALAAWEAIITYGQARAGQKVLIHGAAGGVGHFAVQLARHLGAFVIGTGSPASKEFVIGLGVDQFIDYTSQTIENLVQDADLVLDPMPGPHIFQSLTAAKPGGRVISLLPYDDHDGRMAAVVNQKRLFTHRVVVSSNGGTMKEIASLLQSGVLKPHLSMVFPFAELPLAHSAIDTSHTKGKIVVLGPQ